MTTMQMANKPMTPISISNLFGDGEQSSDFLLNKTQVDVVRYQYGDFCVRLKTV